MPYITSANIAFGFHAGDPQVMEATVRLSVAAGVRIGAHPGYPDLQGFGRRSMDLSPAEVESLVLYQVAALAGFTRSYRTELRHVKPHGALYNQAAASPALAEAIARAVKRFSQELVLVGLAGSALVDAARAAGLSAWAEGFPERGYNPDGSLRSRKLAGALIHDPGKAAENAWRLATQGIEVETGGQPRWIAVDTLCIHGDSPNAVAIARAIQARLRKPQENSTQTLKSLD
jgi:UPF0271 protein